MRIAVYSHYLQERTVTRGAHGRFGSGSSTQTIGGVSTKALAAHVAKVLKTAKPKAVKVSTKKPKKGA